MYDRWNRGVEKESWQTTGRGEKKPYEDLIMALNKQRTVSEELQKSNKQFEEYLKKLENTIGITSAKRRVVCEATI